MARGWHYTKLSLYRVPFFYLFSGRCILKKNQNAPRPFEHPPVRGKKLYIASFFLSFLFGFVMFSFALVGAL